MKWKFVYFYLFLSVSVITFAQTSKPRIKGKIVESGTTIPIDYVDILLYEEGKEKAIASTVSDKNGIFAFKDIRNGTYSIVLRLLGYKEVRLNKVLLKDNNTHIDLGTTGMEEEGFMLEELEFTERRNQIVYKLDKKVIEASSNLLSDGGTAVDILENTPSIRIDAEGEVTFRGSSGFIVYVNGKPSAFTGTQALEQIPSSQIENIEIITTPSARHETEGEAGIINIITKRHHHAGLSGMVNVSGSTFTTREADFLLTHPFGNSRWYIGGNWSNRIRKSNFKQHKTTIVADTATISHSDGPRKSNNFNYSLKVGWDYSYNNTFLQADVEGGYAGRERWGDLDYREERKRQNILFESGDYISKDEYDLHETYWQGNIGFSQSFNEKEHNLKGNFFLKYGGDALEYFQSDLFDLNGDRQQGHRAWEDEHRWTVRGNLDYKLPYRPDGTLEAGYQYFSYLEDGDYSMQFWNPETQEFYWREDIYNTFYFQRGIHSVYALVNENYKNFNIQTGLRGEHTHRVLRSSIDGSNRVVNRFDLFPSVNVGYDFEWGDKIILSYSRRTTRPELFFMEPYITYRDYYSAEIGNPDIRPEYIHSFELNYEKMIGDHAISATVFHRYRKDKIERLRVPYEAGVTLDSMANVGKDYSTGAEVNSRFTVTRWWGTVLNGSFYYYKVDNKLDSGSKDKTSNNYEIALNNTFDAGKNTRIQVDGHFVGPSVTTQGRTNEFWYINLAVRQQFLKRKLNATLSFRDVFNSARYVSNINTADLQSATRIRPRYPLITLTLGYTFNNFRIKPAQGKESHDLFEGTNH